jgi:hypothetical protein
MVQFQPCLARIPGTWLCSGFFVGEQQSHCSHSAEKHDATSRARRRLVDESFGVADDDSRGSTLRPWRCDQKSAYGRLTSQSAASLMASSAER